MKFISAKFYDKALNFTLFNMEDERIVASGVFENIGLEKSCYTITYNNNVVKEEVSFFDCVEVVKILLNKLVSLEIIHSKEDIKGIGYFVPYGGELFQNSVLLNERNIKYKQLESLVSFPSIHMQNNIDGIKAFQEVFSDIPLVGVFDTAFYSTIDEAAYLFAVPRRWYTEYGVRKYGFNGINHSYVTNCIEKILSKDNFKLISCYIGKEEASISAISNGKCIDTSMSFSSCSGVITGTNCGDVDPSIIPYIMEKEGKNASEVLDDLTYNSGLLGMSEITSDIVELMNFCEDGNEKAILAKNKYVRRIVDFIAQFYVLLGGVDVISFSGSVGESLVPLRREICEKLSSLGVRINLDENNMCNETRKISMADSEALVYVVSANEPLMIAREAWKVLNR